ncbi:alpha-2-macroglobulin-like protein 1 isoform X2 [Rhinatrema bivittatum]|uniref:alpha-2-macroglobulin-like protein 1 isoform X2 n=1 Tax=Rhinatrema bivittatum TaxID=194408 RepID=UPI00112E7F8A|nr:alpha-2-macroglobulin-like protein 1 isoform X2 [Rhinatrema bivittatum]
MWIQLSLSCFLLLQRTVGQFEEMHYLVMMPAEIACPSEAKCCLHVKGAMEGTQLTVNLRTENWDQLLLERSLGEQEHFECATVQVPPLSNNVEEVGTLQVSFLDSKSSMQFSKSKQVLLKRETQGCIIQTNQPTYKPGETVRIRLICFNKTFIASNDKYPLVDIQDPEEYRIAQWRNVAPEQGILDLAFTLSPVSKTGIYTINVEHPEAKQTFHVEDKGRQKWELLIRSSPSVVTPEDSSLDLNICGRHVSGNAAQGLVKVTVCRQANHYYWYEEGRPQDICLVFSGQTNDSGCISWTADVKTFQLSMYGYDKNLNVVASLVEDETDEKVQANVNIPLSFTIAEMKFDDTDSNYKPNMPYKGKMKLFGADGTPRKGEEIYLILETNDRKTEHSYITDDAGTASFSLDTANWGNKSVILRAVFKKEKPAAPPGQMVPLYRDAIKIVAPFRSGTNTALKIQKPDDPLSCGQSYQVKTDYRVPGSDLEEGRETLEMVHIVMSKGEITESGKTVVKIWNNSVQQGSFDITVHARSHIASAVNILLYTVLPQGKVSADSAKLPVSRCLNNKVKLLFSRPEGLPFSNVTLHLQAAPGSFCSVRVLDKSLLLTRPEVELTSDSVLGLFSDLDPVGYPHQVMEPDPPCLGPGPRDQKRSLPEQRPGASGHRVRKRSSARPSSTENQRDVSDLLQDMNLKVITNMKVKKSRQCTYDLPPVAAQTGDDGLRAGGGEDPLYFMTPELGDEVVPSTEGHDTPMESQLGSPGTWIWEMVPVGSSGIANMSYVVPDTITDWEASTICTSNTGFGISSTDTFRTRKPFFMDSTLPNIVIQWETFCLKITVFSNMNNSMQVQVTLKTNEDFDLEPCANCTSISCLRANGSKTFTWNVTALVLGEVKLQVTAEAVATENLCYGERPAVPEEDATDTVVIPVLVQPEGVLVEDSQSNVLCVTGDSTTESFSLILPDPVISGSVQAYFFIIGDVMGKALQYTDNLLAMPYGNGEQTMANLDQNICIMQFLERTGQLTDTTKKNGVQFLMQGYQRMQNYRRVDGSFSAFGDRDPKGNSRLTAKSLKILNAIETNIPVDKKIFRNALAWLKNQQLPSGDFQMEGHPPSWLGTSWRDEVNEKLSNTACIITVLMEVKLPPDEMLIARGLQYLRNGLGEAESPLTQAQLAYAFTLSGEADEGRRALLLRTLHQQAETHDGQLHWSLKGRSTSQFWSEEETASYVLLSHASKEKASKEEIMKASQIAAWISRQKSAQNTPLALQALTAYTNIANIGAEGIQLTVTSSSGFQHSFTVGDSNQFLLQEVSLSDIPEDYSVEAQGHGCLFFQVNLWYYIPLRKSNVSFALSVETERWNCSIPFSGSFNLTVQVRYVGPQSASDKVVLEVRQLSGYSVTEESVRMTEQNPLVKSTTISNNKLLIQLEQLTSENQTFTFSMKKEIPVRNLQPQFVKVFDFYKPDEKAIVEYNSPCSRTDNKENYKP